jgi:chromatin structure-remodeling complex subunit RSC1/2
LTGLQTRLRGGEYENPQAFDREMHETFLKARRFHEAGSDAYGTVLLLQVSRITSCIRISLTM